MTRRWVVEPNAVGGWDVRPEDAGHVFRSSTRSEAEQEARRRAGTSGAEVVVLDGRGGVLDTFVPPPRARAPRRSAGARRAAAQGDPPRPAEGRPGAPPRAPVPPPAEPADDPLARFADAVAKGEGDIADRVAQAGRGEVEHRADAALGRGFTAWYAGADADQRLAAKVLIAAALLGPVGATLLTVAKALAHPTLTTQIVTSLFWLAVLTLPVVAAAVTGVLVLGHANGPVSLMVTAAAAVVGAYLVGVIGVPDQLGELYCYASLNSDGVVYEHACRVMETRGFVTGSLTGFSPSTSPQILGNAFGLVAEARGFLMAVCGVAAGLSCGYLIRRSSHS